MRHLVSGRKLKRTASHRKALMANLATSLFAHKKLVTTEAKAKELRPLAEHLITKAKHALARERQGLLPEGQSIDIHNRRIVGKIIRQKAVLQELFDAIAPVVEARNGGYTRIVKLGIRRGDAAKTAKIELVDWAAPQDGVVSMKKKKKSNKPQAKKQDSKPTVEVAPVVAPAVVEEVAPVEEIIETPEVVEEVVAPVAEEVSEVADNVEESAIEATEEPKKMVFDDTAEEQAEDSKA